MQTQIYKSWNDFTLNVRVSPAKGVYIESMNTDYVPRDIVLSIYNVKYIWTKSNVIMTNTRGKSLINLKACHI